MIGGSEVTVIVSVNALNSKLRVDDGGERSGHLNLFLKMGFPAGDL